jgi:hypothetical protein
MLAVDQRAERVGRSRQLVAILSLAVDEHRPWMMATGGGDPFLRLYDRRMLPCGGGGGGAAEGRGAHAPQWVAAYAPAHLRAAARDAGRAPPPGRAVTSVAFAAGGGELVGSYAGELIYSFDAAQHARDVEALLYIPETVTK